MSFDDHYLLCHRSYFSGAALWPGEGRGGGGGLGDERANRMSLIVLKEGAGGLGGDALLPFFTLYGSDR